MVKMNRISTYEEVMQQIQLDDFKLKGPDRLATFILESPQLTTLEDDEILEFEKRKRAEQARQNEIEQVAQQRGVSRTQLELLTRSSREPLLEQGDDGFENRVMTNQMSVEMAAYNAATTRAGNIERVRGMLRETLPAPVSLANGVTVHDLATPPNEPIDLHLPSVPETVRAVAGGVFNAASLGADIVQTVGEPSIDLIAEAARLTSRYGPSVARSTMRGAYHSAYMLARGVAAGGQAGGQAAVAAARLLASTVPASHRGRDFQLQNGVSFTGHLVQHAARAMY